MKKGIPVCGWERGARDREREGRGDGEEPALWVQVIPLRALLSLKLVFLIEFRCRYS